MILGHDLGGRIVAIDQSQRAQGVLEGVPENLDLLRPKRMVAQKAIDRHRAGSQIRL
jgi:hypothetical protein